jgi:hypothetical protein
MAELRKDERMAKMKAVLRTEQEIFCGEFSLLSSSSPETMHLGNPKTMTDNGAVQEFSTNQSVFIETRRTR